ncbi:MAG TPA: DUF2304 domain-containing protein [Polyangiales bacterium]|nr:DUF2304 domain-containing protein [Polyangiales bacterium]
MIFSIVLTVFLLGLFVYALLQKKQFPLVGRLLPLVALLGIYVAWFPNETSRWAGWFGIGRGVDLMLYVWIMASGLLFLVLHLKLVAQQRMMTDLVRAVALQQVRVPSEPAREA